MCVFVCAYKCVFSCVCVKIDQRECVFGSYQRFFGDELLFTSEFFCLIVFFIFQLISLRVLFQFHLFLLRVNF